MVILKVHSNTPYSKRVTIPASIIKALNDPKEFELTIVKGQILLKPKEDN